MRKAIFFVVMLVVVIGIKYVGAQEQKPEPDIALRTGGVELTLSGTGNGNTTRELCGDWFVAKNGGNSTYYYDGEVAEWRQTAPSEFPPTFQGCLDGNFSYTAPIAGSGLRGEGRHSYYFAQDPVQNGELDRDQMQYDVAWVDLRQDQVSAIVEMDRWGLTADYRIIFNCWQDLPAVGTPFFRGSVREGGKWVEYPVVEFNPGACYADILGWQRGDWLNYSFGREDNSTGEMVRHWADPSGSRSLFIPPGKEDNPNMWHYADKLGNADKCLLNNTGDSVVTHIVEHEDFWRIYFNYPKILPVANYQRLFVSGQSALNSGWVEYQVIDAHPCYYIEVSKEDFPLNSKMQATACVIREDGIQQCLDLDKHPSIFDYINKEGGRHLLVDIKRY